ncbi:hypothetical protein [Clostridium sp. Cult1]|uniref:hypothetical protein n=1 Tax=Clostridium sp. Cult1 TaxID=2079002 RepID=UPI001F2302A6|nr:hypothetical protein [Clostridium sp. Cult1]MCF6464169.1 hypothetical protein [Clostridium sp. Cult1]
MNEGRKESMDSIKIEFTLNELDIINRALTGHERDLSDLIEGADNLGFKTIDEEKELEKVKELNQRIRDEKWEAQFSKYR